LLVNGAPERLGARAFDVLAVLDTQTDRVVSKQELLEQVWGGLAVEEGNLTVQISTLRKVLGARAISTEPGVGYKLAAKDTPEPALALSLVLPSKPFLAVLKFANLTGDPSAGYLVDRIVTDLIGSLTRMSGIFMIAATSSFAYKGCTADLADVGRDLGVRYVLEGSIQRGRYPAHQCAIGRGRYEPHDLKPEIYRPRIADFLASGPDHRKRDRRVGTDPDQRRNGPPARHAHRQPASLSLLPAGDDPYSAPAAGGQFPHRHCGPGQGHRT
jgi:hypothetical protein